MARRILVVDDTKNIREIVAHMLKNRGYEVVESADGEDAWKKATSVNPDLIVLDAMLPNKTGFEICSGLKNDPRFKQIPVIMLTAITQGTDKPDDYWKNKSSADEFMSKPFRAAELVARIDKLLASKAEVNGPVQSGSNPGSS